ncbi:MAG TPA: V-type ATPase 116kDa subunit family protein, partial [Treponemataceae bacterium]|nr:V-type ATPase 116kDa subunit family protein [Treponemataceae bacterium]
MAKTATMRLLELMVLKGDVARVIEYLGKNGNFETQSKIQLSSDSVTAHPEKNSAKELFDKLETTRVYLGIEDVEHFDESVTIPTNEDFEKVCKLLDLVEKLHERESQVQKAKQKADEAYKEALAFSNLKVSYSQLEHLSFLSLRIGKIDPVVVDDLIFSIGERAVIIPLGKDKTRILAASSKKGRFALDGELKKFGFVPLEIPTNFKGIPDDMLAGLKAETKALQEKLDKLIQERHNFSDVNKETLLPLLQTYSLGAQVFAFQEKLESTQLVYRITGWVPEFEVAHIMKGLDELTHGRVVLREFTPQEVPSVRDGREQVPVKLKHGRLVENFERMIFSYGAPLYGTIDPTPFVAFFYTLLFGIMFGDLGQGLVFVALGVLMITGVIKNFPVLGSGFGPIFCAIGTSSSVMGLLTGEFFCNEDLLVPWGRWVTGFFGMPRDRIIDIMPSGDAIGKMFILFGFTIAIGFVINSIGLVINITNNFLLNRKGKALFGKNGLSGACFFWYVVFMVLRIAIAKDSIHIYDWVIIATTLFGVFAAGPLSRLVDKEKPAFEDGVGVGIIEGFVEILETLSGYLSNSVSFLRVGAFAIAHAVLGFIVFTLQDLAGGIGGLSIFIIGNLVIIVLEGMIVAIQVVRLQYYEFFSKFFTESGKEFKPLTFKYK